MTDSELLKILCCPETPQGLHLADPALVDKQITTGGLKNRAGRLVQESIAGGFVRADGKFLYPIRENIPVMLMDQAIPLSG